MPQTLVIYESKYGLTEAIAHDVGRILGPARVCRARDVVDEAGAADDLDAGASVCAATFAAAEFVVIVTPVYRHAPDEHILGFVRANLDRLRARPVALVCVGLATSAGAVRSYLQPLLDLLGDGVV